MAREFRAYIRRHHIGLLALFFAATGGVAWASHGAPNTIDSADIINGEVRAADIGTDQVNTAEIGASQVRAGDLAASSVNGSKIVTGAVASRAVADDTLNESDLAGVELLQAKTVELHDEPGGGSAGQTLFEIGRVRLNAFCSVQSGGVLFAGISPVVGEPGALMVTDGDAGGADDAVALQPEDVQFVAIVNSTAATGRERSFSILDSGGAQSASGVAAVSVTPATGDCVITAHAIG